MSATSSVRTSAKVSNLLDFLESQDSDNKLSFLDSLGPDPDALSAYSETKAKMINLKIDLEESTKNTEALRNIIDKLKYQLEEQDRSWQDKLNRELQRQQIKYDEALEKNVNFIESLLKEKEQRLILIKELNTQISQNEDNYKASINSLHEHYRKELKKSKDAWVTSEKLKREKWEKEKAKEIKEMTARGLEPEINRLVSNNRKSLEEKDEANKKEIKSLRDNLESKHSEEMVAII